MNVSDLHQEALLSDSNSDRSYTASDDSEGEWEDGSGSDIITSDEEELIERGRKKDAKYDLLHATGVRRLVGDGIPEVDSDEEPNGQSNAYFFEGGETDSIEKERQDAKRGVYEDDELFNKLWNAAVREYNRAMKLYEKGTIDVEPEPLDEEAIREQAYQQEHAMHVAEDKRMREKEKAQAKNAEMRKIRKAYTRYVNSTRTAGGVCMSFDDFANAELNADAEEMTRGAPAVDPSMYVRQEGKRVVKLTAKASAPYAVSARSMARVQAKRERELEANSRPEDERDAKRVKRVRNTLFTESDEEISRPLPAESSNAWNDDVFDSESDLEPEEQKKWE